MRLNMFKQRSRRLLIISGLSLFLMLFLDGCGAMRKAEAAKDMAIPSPDISSLEDGTRRGAWDAGLVKAEVLVSVEKGKITGIKLLRHDTGKGKPAESIIESVMAAQSLDVDVVSGATVSSKTILKAVEHALVQR
jgi:uncharacterized protein with FMN-binding domain